MGIPKRTLDGLHLTPIDFLRLAAGIPHSNGMAAPQRVTITQKAHIGI